MFMNGIEVDKIAITRQNSIVETFEVGKDGVAKLEFWEGGIFQITYDGGEIDVGIGFMILAHKNAPVVEKVEEGIHDAVVV